MARYGRHEREEYYGGYDRGHSRGRSHARHRHTRSRSESPWSRNVRPRRSRHDRSRSPQLDCRRDRSRGRNYGEHYDYGGPRRHVDVFDYYDSDSSRIVDIRLAVVHDHAIMKTPVVIMEVATIGEIIQRAVAHVRATTYRDQERSGRSRSKARHYGGDNHARGRSDAPRHRSRSRHHVVPPDHRERGRSVVTRSHSRARSSAGDRSSVQTPSSAASAVLSTEVGPADDEWIGSNQPLTTSVEDLFLCGSIPLSNRSGAGSSGRAQNLKSNCYQVTLDAAKCQRIFQYHQCIELGGDATPERNTNPGNQLFGGRRLTRTLLRQVVLDAIQQHPDTFGGVIVVHDGANALFSASALPVPDDGVTLNVRSSARNSYGIDPPGVSKGKTRPYTVHVKLAEELETSLLEKAFSDPALDVDPLVYALDAVAKAGIIGS